ncbi:MAG TPA: site-specific integrase [Chloroflexota bacterium]|jgi:integrase/recombinase XerC|nr:site-specific integrase [Chloroflexota bacterium]
MSAQLSTALVPYLGPGDDGATAWLRLSPAERRRTAMQAARDHDTVILWSLTEAWLRSFGRVGATISPATIRSYRTGVQALLDAWTKETVLQPGPDAATLYLRQLERRGLAASTIQARLAAARGLFAALRWCRAIVADPFADCRAPRDTTPAWDKRMPYGDDEVAALVQVAGPDDRVLVLLGAHAGLRAQECADLRWAEVHLARRDLLVRHGKGGKQRLVALSASLRQSLATLPRRADGFVLGYRTAGSAWRHMYVLCTLADVTARGMHALRHTAGTRLYAETHDLEATARHLGHSKLETTRIYAKWSDRQLRETIGRW